MIGIHTLVCVTLKKGLNIYDTLSVICFINCYYCYKVYFFALLLRRKLGTEVKNIPFYTYLLIGSNPTQIGNINFKISITIVQIKVFMNFLDLSTCLLQYQSCLPQLFVKSIL